MCVKAIGEIKFFLLNFGIGTYGSAQLPMPFVCQQLTYLATQQTPELCLSSDKTVTLLLSTSPPVTRAVAPR